MVVWILVGAALLAVLSVAWLMDRRRTVAIDRRDPAVESQIARATLDAQVRRTGNANQGLL